MGPLVHMKIAANAVSGAMGVVQAFAPHHLPRNAVQLLTTGSTGEHATSQCDMGTQHGGVKVTLARGRGAAGQHPGHVGRALGILATGIDQQQLTVLELCRTSRLGQVMGLSAIGTGGGDGLETRALIIGMPRAPALKRFDDRQFALSEKPLALAVELIQEPAQGQAIDTMCFTTATQLGGLFAGPL
ncbi:hypothetical protein D3C75_626740 [compost metagenome]